MAASACSASRIRLASPAARARASRASASATCSRIWASNGLADGSVRRQAASTACLTLSSTARSRRSRPAAESRGTRPMSCHWPWISRSRACAARGSASTSSASASARSCCLRSRLARSSASRAEKTSLRRVKKASWAARNRSHNRCSASFEARGAAFQAAISSLSRAAVAAQSVESASASACTQSSSLAACACLRCASRVAKWAPRRRVNASRAAANRFHSSPSVFLSIPRIVFHSSRISLSRSPALFHPVDSAASFSASSTSSVLRAIASARAASRAARAEAARSSAAAASLSSRAARPSMSPTTCAESSELRSRRMLASEWTGSAAPVFIRVSIRSTSVTRSANRRAKWASPSSGVPACQEPTARSPAAVFTQTVPSGSTRPKAVQSLMCPSSFSGAAGRGPDDTPPLARSKPLSAFSQVCPGPRRAPVDDRDHTVSLPAPVGAGRIAGRTNSHNAPAPPMVVPRLPWIACPWSPRQSAPTRRCSSPRWPREPPPNWMRCVRRPKPRYAVCCADVLIDSSQSVVGRRHSPSTTLNLVRWPGMECPMSPPRRVCH